MVKPSTATRAFDWLLSSDNIDHARAFEFKLDIEERWALFELVADFSKLRWMHFIHVPKTAGTSLLHNISDAMILPVFSIDDDQERLLGNLFELIQGSKGTKILTRSHDTYPFIRDAVQHLAPVFQFSFFRSPEDLHRSNASMVARRMSSFLAGEPQDTDVLHYCEYWKVLLEAEGVPLSDRADLASIILKTRAYQEEFSNIYTRYFGDCSEAEFNNIHFFLHSDTNEFLEVFLGITEPQSLNISERCQPTINGLPDGLVSETEASLIQLIRSKLTTPQKTLAHIGNLFLPTQV